MELTAVSFNILCVDHPIGGSIPDRACRVRRVIRPLQPDLIGFQEATPRWMEYLTRDYADAYGLYNVYRSEESPESTPIAWRKDRFTCLDRGCCWFSDTPEVESPGWDEVYKCPRIFTWARLREKASGREFCFVNTHFGFGDQCQIKSAALLKAFGEKAGCPCVILGDFNMETDSPGYREMTAAFRDVNAQTVNDTGFTYHGFDPDDPGEHIDYCFASEAFRPVSFRVLRDLVEELYPSDHYGLFASLEL